MPIQPTTGLRAAAVALVLAAGAAAITAANANDVVRRIEQRAASMDSYLKLLDAPSQATRIAALSEMAGSTDTAMVDLAIETGLKSSDPAMRAIAMRAGFRQVSSLVAKLAPSSGAAAAEVVKACGDAVQYRIEGYKHDTGKFEAHGQDHAGVGQVNGTTVSITIDYGCSLTAALQPDGTLAGLVSAPYKKGSLPIRATFR
jgi:hypothetical protein